MGKVQENSFYIETYGCTSNKADSYIMINTMKKANYSQTSLENAQFIIINTCAVKEQTENKIKARLDSLHRHYQSNPNKHIIIAGCLPHITSNYIEVIRKIVPTFSAIIDLNNIIDLPDILQEIKNGERNLVLKSDKSIDKSNYLFTHTQGKINGIALGTKNIHIFIKKIKRKYFSDILFNITTSVIHKPSLIFLIINSFFYGNTIKAELLFLFVDDIDSCYLKIVRTPENINSFSRKYGGISNESNLPDDLKAPSFFNAFFMPFRARMLS